MKLSEDSLILKPKISIFTPVHKINKYFEYCVESILNQTYENWEWVVLDNSMDKETPNVIEYFINYKIKQRGIDRNNTIFDKIKVYIYNIERKEDRNIGNLKSTVANLCTGDLLLEMDYDDILIDDALLAVAQSYNNNPEYSWYYSDHINMQFEENGCYSRNGNFIDTIQLNDILPTEKYALGEMKKKCIDKTMKVFAIPYFGYPEFEALVLPLKIKIWNRTFYHTIGGFDNSLPYEDDNELILRSYINATKICRISYPCCIINYHDKNTTDTLDMDKVKQLRHTIWVKYDIDFKHKYVSDGDDLVERFIPKIKEYETHEQ